MKFAVSNIAWAPDQRLAAYAGLQARGVTGLEIAPGLFFDGAKDIFVPDDALAQARLAEISEAGLTLVSMQSLLFGVEGAALFGKDDALVHFEQGMKRALDLAGRFGIPTVVFGAPKQRIIPEGMDPAQANDHASEVFHRLSNHAATLGTTIAIEGNPAAYGTNFLTHTEEVVDFVSAMDRPAIRVILDLGAQHMNDVFVQTPKLIGHIAHLLSHVHVSEPYLGPAPASTAAISTILAALKEAGYSKWISIEMKATEQDSVAQMCDAVDRLKAAAMLVEGQP
jgi:sugar phosphate isomerase/epimerase